MTNLLGELQQSSLRVENGRSITTNLSSRPERSAVGRSAVLFSADRIARKVDKLLQWKST
jgi:hypothetical protein